MKVSDMAGIQRAKFGAHTKLVHTLARAVERMAEALWRKRVPVLVIVECDGTFNVYGERNAEVEVVHVPSDWAGMSRAKFEEWMDRHVIPKRHVEIHQSSCWLARGGKQFCVPLDVLLERVERQLLSKALDLPIARNRLATTTAGLEASSKELGL